MAEQIKMYIPTQDEIMAYLHRHNIGIMQEKDGQIQLAQCPFCGSGEGAKDAKNSGCYISIDTGKWQCFRKEKCNAHGTWRKFQKMLLLRAVDMLDADIQCGASDISLDTLQLAKNKASDLGLDVTDYIDNTAGNGKVVDKAQIAVRKEQERKNREYNVMDAADVRKLELTGDCYTYMVDTRKLDPDVLRAYNIVNDPTIAGVVLIPHMDISGAKILFAKRRWIAPEQDCPKETTVKDTSPCFWGLQNLGHGTKGLIITEGQIDALSVLSAGAWNVGYDVISVPLGKDNFSFVSASEIDILQSYNNIIVFGDLENGKISMVQDIEDIAGIPVSTVPVDYYKDCKDANDILRNYGNTAIIDAIQHATVYAPHRVNIADVDLGDDDDRYLFSTGYDEIDRMIGGITAGKLILLAAKEGVGKSTLALNLAIRAADAGVKTYLYSGEMRQKDIVRDLILQAAGPYSTTWQTDEATCRTKSVLRIPSHQPIIINWLSEHIALHQPDDMQPVQFGAKTMLCDAFKTVNDLIADIEREAKRKTAEFFVIDNMMVLLASAGESTDLFAAQGLLAQECKRITNKYDVTILLCVHARKEKMYRGDQLTTDSISGSSTPKNLSDIVLCLTKYQYDWDDEGKVKEENKISHTWDDIILDAKIAPTSILRILKNRRYGITHMVSGEGVYTNRDLGLELDAEGCFLWYVRNCKSLLDANQIRDLRSRQSEGLVHGWTKNVKMV